MIHKGYATKYTGGNQPPDCCSFDGVTGEGEPGGACRKCPLNQFGSGENGAKACKNRRRIYVLREGEIFPLLLSLPTGSLQGSRATSSGWLDEKQDLNAMLPYLQAYMGHETLAATAYYIHLLPEKLVKSSGIDWEALHELIPEVSVWQS